MAFQKYNIAFQHVPQHKHQANAAKRAILMFKNHFISILSSVNSDFPLSEWDQLLPQMVTSLNLLWLSQIHPSLSAQAFIFGNFNFNRTSMAPPGTKVVAHTPAKT